MTTRPTPAPLPLRKIPRCDELKEDQSSTGIHLTIVVRGDRVNDWDAEATAKLPRRV
jgi:hypothetical protein